MAAFSQDDLDSVEESSSVSGSAAEQSASDAAEASDGSANEVPTVDSDSSADQTAEAPSNTAPTGTPQSPSPQIRKDSTGKKTVNARSRKKQTTARDQFHKKPLYFDQIDFGIEFQEPELVYDIESSQGYALKMGDVELSEKTFFVALLSLDRAHPQMKRIANTLSKAPALILRYPDKMISSGTLEMLSRTGDVLWAQQITETDRENWGFRLDDWRADLLKRGAPPAQLRKSGLFATQFAIENFPVEILSRQDNIFKFCLSSKTEKGSARLCSQWYGSRRQGNSVQIALARVDEITPRVLVYNKVATLKAEIPVNFSEPVNFYAELKKGQSYEFIAEPTRVDVADFADTVRPNVYKMVGFNTRPTQTSVILNPDESRSIKAKIGFADTIGDFRKFWATLVKKENPELYFPGQGGGIFRQKLKLTQVPKEAARPFLRNDMPVVTYSTRPKIYGKINEGVELSTKQNSVEVFGEKMNLFQWTLEAPDRGKMNRSYLDVQYEGKTYRAYTEIFRSYSNEISGRFSGLATAAGFLIMGEAAYNKWFESIFGWDNYYLSRLRWGLSTKYFQTFTPLQVDSEGTKANINVLTVDLKYRASPGVWGREETVGAILSYQNLNYGEIKAPMIGFGAFWARSMPKVFDDLFNYLPYMNYPKFVDMEFIYYPVTTKANLNLLGNFALNFHGKVHWTDTIFGEAGFGVKRYAVQDLVLAQQAALNTFYGTVGLGLNF